MDVGSASNGNTGLSGASAAVPKSWCLRRRVAAMTSPQVTQGAAMLPLLAPVAKQGALAEEGAGEVAEDSRLGQPGA